MDDKYVMTATDLMNYLYCPRIIYFVHVLKKPQFTTKKEYVGRDKSRAFEHKAKRAKVVKDCSRLPKVFSKQLFSTSLMMRTTADAIMFNATENEAYPIQAKYSYKPKAVFRGQRLQLMLEGLLIEEVMGMKVPHGFIKFVKSGDLVKVWLGDKSEVLECLKAIKAIFSAECVPAPTGYKKRCVDCCYRNIC